jgi:hypothetical protein
MISTKKTIILKKSEIKVTLKLGDVLNASNNNAWFQMCEKYGVNEWCLNEGIANFENTIEVNLEDAEQWGLVESEKY